MAAEYRFLAAPENASSLSPSAARDIFRINKYYGTTSGFCRGYVQANLAVVPASCADEFEEFCRRNCGPLPLLYRSKPGERTAPPLADNSDVRRDLPRYLIFNHSRQVSDMLDLDGFNWDGYVSFYTGCSFSFEKPLVDAGISFQNGDGNKCACIYKTNVNCYSVSERLSGVKMIVTMRPIKMNDLERCYLVTSCYPVCAHGAPMHIGDPSQLGLNEDLTKSVDILGTAASIGSDEVPVFWACGVTGKPAVEALGAGLTFTHYPGSMFITDIPIDSMIVEPPSDQDMPLIIQISAPSMPYWASVITSKVLGKLNALEEAILDDPGGCGVREIREEGDFVKSILVLSHAKSVAIVFGFPVNFGYPSLEETDGPSGAFAIAQALQALGKKVVIVSELRNKDLVDKCSEYLISKGALKTVMEFVSCVDFIKSGREEYDVLIAIERVGQAKDGGHYSCTGRDLTSLVDPIDPLFTRDHLSNHVTSDHVTSTRDHVITIGIGDRGNELGLGKVQDRVSHVMKNGSTLGCTIVSDRVIMAGVSNWGGFAIAAGLYLLTTCDVHWRYVCKGINYKEEREWTLDQFLTTNEQAEGVLVTLNKLGVVDGVNKSDQQSVDGIPLQAHLEKLRQIRDIVNQDVIF